MDVSWLNLLSQHARLLTLDTALPEALLVERFHGREALCEPFRFQVDCLSASAGVDTTRLTAQPMTLRMARADGGQRAWHGYVSGVAELGSDGGMARYRLTLVSWLAFLQLRRNTLIFQEADVRAITEQVFADYPQAAFRFEVSQPLRTRALCTQFRESDLDFVLRLWAEEGLAFRFEHLQDDDDASDHHEGQARHTLVIFDREAELPVTQPEHIRFHRIAATETEDSFSTFAERRQLTANAATVARWQADDVASTHAQAEADPGALPALEAFDADRAGALPDAGYARQIADLRLASLRVPARVFGAYGSVRTLAAGHRFTLVQHPNLSAQAFVALAIEHEAANNLGSDIAPLLASTDIEAGGYRQRLLATTADTALVPGPRARPHVGLAQTAQVVGTAGDTLTATRDHQVRVQFHWQRGEQPLAGGATDTGSVATPQGHAPGDARSGAWVRVAETLAGPNFGSAFVPRIGAEVLVEFLHGDIDQPVVVRQLYNGTHTAPFAAGVEAGANHIGTLSGMQTQSLDGSCRQHWVLDDAPGQLRQQLGTEQAQSTLGLGYLIEPTGSRRGPLRGRGFELTTHGWTILRAPQGLLASTSARPRRASTQMDVNTAVGQLAAAIDAGKRMQNALQGAQAGTLDARDAGIDLHRDIDPEQDGVHTGPVNGQSATKPTASARDGGDPVERFAAPHLLLESPETIALTSPKSVAAFAGRHVSITSPKDLHITGAATAALASGDAVTLLAQRDDLKTIAAHGPLSIEAHTDALRIQADQAVTVTSTEDRIDILAQQKIVLQAGQSAITLEGGDITLACPGNFTAKGAKHPFASGESGDYSAVALPEDTVTFDGNYLFSV